MALFTFWASKIRTDHGLSKITLNMLPNTLTIFLFSITFINSTHCVKSVGIRSYSGPYFPAFGLNADQNNSEYGHFLRSDWSE